VGKATDEEGNMKKFVIVGLLAFSIVGAAFSATLDLTATVGNILSVSLSASTKALGAITTAGVAEQTAATATFRTNVTPWHVAVSSTNAGKLKHATEADTIAYTFSLGDWIVGATLPSTAPTSAGPGYYSGTGTMLGAGVNKAILITIPAFTDAVASGNYADTITVTIATGA
jgi:hypothetical protein